MAGLHRQASPGDPWLEAGVAASAHPPRGRRETGLTGYELVPCPAPSHRRRFTEFPLRLPEAALMATNPARRDEWVRGPDVFSRKRRLRRLVALGVVAVLVLQVARESLEETDGL